MSQRQRGTKQQRRERERAARRARDSERGQERLRQELEAEAGHPGSILARLDAFRRTGDHADLQPHQAFVRVGNGTVVHRADWRRGEWWAWCAVQSRRGDVVTVEGPATCKVCTRPDAEAKHRLMAAFGIAGELAVVRHAYGEE